MAMGEKASEADLGIGAPWYVADASFYAAARTLTIRVDFTPSPWSRARRNAESWRLPKAAAPRRSGH